MKSIIIIYDDLFELDRTEVAYQGETQLKSIVKSLMADYPESEKAEVYNKITQSLVYAYRRDSKGNVYEIERYVRKRAVSHAPRNTVKLYTQRMTFWMEPAVYERLDALRGKRAKYVRDAVVEKLEREGNPLPPDPCPKAEGHPDRRYHRMFKNLPQSIRTYDARTTYRSPSPRPPKIFGESPMANTPPYKAHLLLRTKTFSRLLNGSICGLRNTATSGLSAK